MNTIQTLKRRVQALWRELRYEFGALYWRLRGYHEDGGTGVRVPTNPKSPLRPAGAARRLPKR